MTSRAECEERAKRIEQFYIKHGKDKKKTYDHFVEEGINKRTITRAIRRHDETGEVRFKKPTGRRVTVCTSERFKKLADLFKNNPEISSKDAAQELGVSRTAIFRLLAKMREQNLETYRVVGSEPRCPTCHQRMDPKKFSLLKAKKERTKRDRTKPTREEVNDVPAEGSQSVS